MKRTRLTAIALATTMLMVSGCGSSPKPLTRAELIAKADAICKKVTAKLASSGTSKGQQGIARVATELASFEQAALTDLSKLVPPTELANDWKQFVAGAQTLAENTSKLGEYAKANDLKAARGLITSSVAVQRQMQATAKRDGLKDCEQVA